MQRLSYHLASGLRTRTDDLILVSWGKSQAYLPLFYPLLFLRAFAACRKQPDVLLLGDPMLAPIGFLLKQIFHLATVITVHGLDITFRFPPYQQVIPRLVRRCDAVVCISQNTMQLCLNREIPRSKCRVIHPGVEIPFESGGREKARILLQERIGKDLDGVQVLLTVGRLVERKGVEWFLNSVFPFVRDRSNCVYLIAGTGPEEGRIRKSITEHQLEEAVFLMGCVSQEDLRLIYNAADLFLMPNLPVKRDVEGFGLVALEAAAHGLFVFASDLEGIRDAVKPDLTGRLLRPGDASLWISHINRLLEEPGKLQQLGSTARKLVMEDYGWDQTADRYLEVFHEIREATRLG